MVQAMLGATQRTYYKDNVLMERVYGEYYSDPLATAERIVRIIALHDNVTDPADVTPAKSFEEIGLNALDMCEVFMGVEREFDFEIDEEDCEAMHTVNDLIEFVARSPHPK